jgi:hypothetical protein
MILTEATIFDDKQSHASDILWRKFDKNKGLSAI